MPGANNCLSVETRQMTRLRADPCIAEMAESEVRLYLEDREGRPLSDPRRKMVATFVRYFASMGERDPRRLRILALAGLAHYQWWLTEFPSNAAEPPNGTVGNVAG